MGTVYKARNKHVPERICALKVVKQELSHSEEYKKRFLREAQALIRARHRHIVEAYDVYETTDGVLFLVMEFLSGRTLDTVIQAHPARSLPLSQALYIVDQVAEALHHGHGLKIIHRDIKPGNIFLTQEAGDPNFVKMVDFGLARLMEQAALTNPSQIMGTLGYLAPDIVLGGDYLSPALDVYSLGCTLFELLTGNLPFDLNDFDAMIGAHLNLIPPRLAERKPGTVFPAELEDLVRSMLAKKRQDRPTLPDLRKKIQQLRDRLPRRTVQSMMIASTEPDLRVALHERKTLLKPDAKVRWLEGKLIAIEHVEIERTTVGSEIDAVVDKVLNGIASQMTPELDTLRGEWVENRYRDQTVQQELEKLQARQLQDDQVVMRRKAEMHQLIEKVRSDIRKHPAHDTAQLARDEKILAEVERAYFGMQPQPQLPEGVARLLNKQQKYRHRYFLSLHKLGIAVLGHVRGLARSRGKFPKPSDLRALETSLEHLYRCNQNVESLVAELPAELR